MRRYLFHLFIFLCECVFQCSQLLPTMMKYLAYANSKHMHNIQPNQYDKEKEIKIVLYHFICLIQNPYVYIIAYYFFVFFFYLLLNQIPAMKRWGNIIWSAFHKKKCVQVRYMHVTMTVWHMNIFASARRIGGCVCECVWRLTNKHTFRDTYGKYVTNKLNIQRVGWKCEEGTKKNKNNNKAHSQPWNIAMNDEMQISIYHTVFNICCEYVFVYIL